MNVLMLWSGGVESTSYLKWQLENTNDNIFAHRIIFHNTENRDANEQQAIEQLLPRLRSIRDFHYDTSYSSICEGKALPLDRDLYIVIGTLAMRHHCCLELRRGYCAEDRWSRYWTVDSNNVKTFTYVKDISLESNHLEKAITATHFLPKQQTLTDVIKINETAYWPKAKHVEYLGDLFQYTWSCRNPVNMKECGWCHSCKERKAAMRGTSYIPEVARRMK